MPIDKPFHRIWRPVKGYDWSNEVCKTDENAVYPTLGYLYDERFASQGEKKSLITATSLIMRDLNEIFNFVEPSNDNSSIYSHRIYELLLRTATEFETNCKGILKANDYTGPREEKDWCVKDYYKITRAARLSEYRITFVRWASEREYTPFIEWLPSRRGALDWYDAYNKVKHDRFANFTLANLDNLMKAVAGLLCILHAQYGEGMSVVGYNGNGGIDADESVVETEMFTIYTPRFSDEEQYDFIWSNLENEPNPVQKFIFDNGRE